MEIHIGDRVADVTLVSKEGNKVQLTIDGQPYEVDIVMAENGNCSILHNGNSFHAGQVSAHPQGCRREAGRQNRGPHAWQGGQHPRQGGRPTGRRRHRHRARGHEDAEQLQGQRRLRRAEHPRLRGRGGQCQPDAD